MFKIELNGPAIRDGMQETRHPGTGKGQNGQIHLSSF